MKKTAILLSLLVMISLSCDKSYKFYAFYIEKTVEVELNGSEINFETTQDVNVSIDNILEAHDTKADLVEEITIEEISMTEANFDMFNDFELFINAEGLTETLIASSDSADVYYDGVLLKVSEDKLDDYIIAPIFNMKTLGQLTTSHSQPIIVKFNLRFLVKTYVK